MTAPKKTTKRTYLKLLQDLEASENVCSNNVIIHTGIIARKEREIAVLQAKLDCLQETRSRDLILTMNVLRSPSPTAGRTL
jgi:hypothetical protein